VDVPPGLHAKTEQASWETVRSEGDLAAPEFSERFKTRATHIQSCPPPTSPHTRRFSAMRSFKGSEKRDSSDDFAARLHDFILPAQAMI